jgi:Helicase associated domain
MSAERLQLLEQLGFEWKPLDRKWADKLQEVIDLGDGLDKSSMDPLEYSECLCKSLSKWFREQLLYYQSGQMTDFQQSIFVPFLSHFRGGAAQWSRATPPRAVKEVLGWDGNFELLKAFKAEHGHTLVGVGHPQLGEWAKRQRKARLSMSLERRQALDELGFVWDVLGHKWNENFQKIVQQRQAMQGRSATPLEFAKYLGRNSAGYNWFLYQLESHAKGELSAERNAKFSSFLSDLNSDKSEANSTPVNFDGAPMSPPSEEQDDAGNKDGDISKDDDDSDGEEIAMPNLGNETPHPKAKHVAVDDRLARDHSIQTFEKEKELKRPQNFEVVPVQI